MAGISIEPLSSADFVRVSVIITCFNYGHLLGSAIDSVLQQTHSVSEIIVVDDGSTDSTRDVVRAYDGLAYLWQRNAGVSAARNHGLASVTGTHILFVDADDTLAPEFVARCLHVLIPSDRGYAYPTLQLVGVADRRIPAPEFDVTRLKRQNFVTVTSLIDRDALGDVRFDTSPRLGWEDWELFVHLARKGIYGVAAVDAVLFYRRHAQGFSRLASQQKNPSAELRALRYIQRKHRGFYSIRERLETERRILRTHGRPIKRRLFGPSPE